MTYLSDLVLLLILLEHPLVHGRFLAVPTVNVIPSYRACFEIEEILQQIRRNISDSLGELFSTSVPECGNGLWYRVAYLNMTDPSQPCPPAWREYNTSGVRGCRRPVFSRGSRPANFYTINQQYSRVYGRIIDYQLGSPDGFTRYHGMISLNQGYMDGVSITYGYPRHHIWSYVAGAFENYPQAATSNCPCSPTQGAEPQEFIGSNYYCESGYPSNTFIPLAWKSLLVIHSGMENSVKIPVAVVPILHHGSVYSYPPAQLIGLRCVFVLMSPLAMKMS